MRERVFGIETEYALIYHPRGGVDSARPTKLELYRRLEAALLRRVRTLPQGFSPLRPKGGRFLENGATFHYEASADEYESGLLEMASPECRDPFALVHFERAKDELVEELGDEVNEQLALAGYRGEMRLGKNNIDSEGHTFGSHESYWVEDRLPLGLRLLFVPLWVLLCLISLPVVVYLLGLRVVFVLLALAAGISLLVVGGLLRLVRPGAAERIFTGMERFARQIEDHPGEIARRTQSLIAPIYPLMSLHSAVYNCFHFRRFRRDLTAFLVSRTLYTGAGALSFDGGPLLRLAQRPPFLKTLARIFPDGDERPLYETRDLFFQPWTALRQRRRLHLLIGDANLSEWAQVLRVGATALVLEAIESGAEIDWPVLAEPLAALRQVNRDPELVTELELTDGRRMTALEIQRCYLDGVRRALGDSTSGSWKQRVISYWEETLDALAEDPQSLADRVDWIAKAQLLRQEIADPRDREELRRRGRELLEDGGALDHEDRRLRDLAFRAWRVDLRYHELGPRGGYRRLEKRGLMRRLTDPERVARARTTPPGDTRAWARGRAIKWAHAQAVSGRAAWHRVRVGKFEWRFFRDPLDSQRGPE
ncbi:MAG: proteasome accessory factor PafA2 family protein [Myxococcota bacterium]